MTIKVYSFFNCKLNTVTRKQPYRARIFISKRTLNHHDRGKGHIKTPEVLVIKQYLGNFNDTGLYRVPFTLLHVEPFAGNQPDAGQ